MCDNYSIFVRTPIAYTLGERQVVDQGTGAGRGDWSGGRGSVAEGTLTAAGTWPFPSYRNQKNALFILSSTTQNSDLSILLVSFIYHSVPLTGTNVVYNSRLAPWTRNFLEFCSIFSTRELFRIHIPFW